MVTATPRAFKIYKNVSEFTKIAGMGRLALVKNRRLSYL
jgi:hypothetical protein